MRLAPRVEPEERLGVRVPVVTEPTGQRVARGQVGVAVEPSAHARREVGDDGGALRHVVESGDVQRINAHRLAFGNQKPDLDAIAPQRGHDGVHRCLDEPVVPVPDLQARDVTRQLGHIETALGPDDAEHAARARRRGGDDPAAQLRVGERGVPGKAHGTHLDGTALAPAVLRAQRPRRRDEQREQEPRRGTPAHRLNRPSARTRRGSTNDRGSPSSRDRSSAPPGSRRWRPHRIPWRSA